MRISAATELSDGAGKEKVAEPKTSTTQRFIPLIRYPFANPSF
jgi:hypothetical protein